MLAGLSPDRLREWAGRRGLVRADVPARGKGSQARFSWRAVLTLRIAAVLRDELRLELQAHRRMLRSLQDALAPRSFAAMRQHILAIDPGGQVRVLPAGADGRCDTDNPVILIPLDPHLRVLAEGFDDVEPAGPRRPDLVQGPW